MHRAKMLSLGRWPGDPGRKPKLITHQKTKPRGLLKNTSNPFLDHLTSFSVAGTTDYDQPSPALCHSNPTTLSTASHTHTLPATPMPGLVTCGSNQQHTAGHSHVPHTTGHTAHHDAVGRDWDTGGGGSGVTTTGLSPMSIHLTGCASSVSRTSEGDVLILD